MTLESEIDLDLTHWPVVVSTAPSGPCRDAPFERYLERFAQVVDSRKGSYVAVVDLRAGGSMTPKQRTRLAEAMGTEERGATCVGTALVFESALMRSMLTAVLWMSMPPYPTRVFSRPVDAIEWGMGLVRGPQQAPKKRFSLWPR